LRWFGLNWHFRAWEWPQSGPESILQRSPSRHAHAPD
jgi:hypothetical protein